MSENFNTLYTKEIAPKLQQEFGCNTMAIPRLEKIVLNMGVGKAASDRKIIEHAVSDLTKIAGQKAVITLARKANSNFGIRENWPVGCKVTLRNKQMYDFLERLICVALPRVRDFRGLKSRSFDKFGAYNMGLTEQICFPEIDYDKIDQLRGMNITICTSAPNAEQAKALLKAFHFPFVD